MEIIPATVFLIIMKAIAIRNVTVSIILIFSHFLMAFFLEKVSRLFLYNLVLLNQSSIFLELLEKKKAASSKKGVVGSTGKATPRAPSPKKINPNIKYTSLIYLLLFKLIMIIKTSSIIAEGAVIYKAFSLILSLALKNLRAILEDFIL